MKIAILLPGLIRNIRSNCVNTYNSIFQNHDTDVYSSIWDIRGNLIKNKNYDSEDSYINESKIDENLIKKVKELYKIDKIKIESFQEWIDLNNDFINTYCKNHKYASKQMTKNGIFSQYYKIIDSYNMIENPNDYDLIIRWRFDIDTKYIDLEKIVKNDLTLFTGSITSDYPTEFVYMGTPSFCKTFSLIYDYIKNMDEFNPKNLNKKHSIYTPEILVKRFLDSHSLKYFNLNINPKIVR